MQFTVSAEHSGMRLDVFLATVADISRSAAEKHISAGAALLNGAVSNKKATVNEGDTVSFDAPAPVECSAVAQDIPLDIVYEDADIVVINKLLSKFY